MKGKRRNPNNLYRYSPPFQEVKRSYILPWVWTKLCDLLSKNGMLERGTITLPWKIPVNTTLARWLMLAPPVMIHVDSTNPLIWWWKRHPSLYLFFPKHYNPNLIIKKTSNKPMLRGILQNTRLVQLKTLKIVKSKEKLRNCNRPDETKEMWH